MRALRRAFLAAFLPGEALLGASGATPASADSGGPAAVRDSGCPAAADDSGCPAAAGDSGCSAASGVLGGPAAFCATLRSTSSLDWFAKASNMVLEVGMPVSGSENAAGARLALLRSFSPYTAYEALSVQASVATALLAIAIDSCIA